MVSQHFPDRLVPSNEGHLSFPIAVQHMFLELSALYERDRSANLRFPDSMKVDVDRWRELVMRHNKGDYQHTEMEWKSVLAVGQWILNVKAELAGEPPSNLEASIRAMKEHHETRSRISTDSS